jgi:hypothetical protein
MRTLEAGFVKGSLPVVASGEDAVEDDPMEVKVWIGNESRMWTSISSVVEEPPAYRRDDRGSAVDRPQITPPASRARSAVTSNGWAEGVA